MRRKARSLAQSQGLYTIQNPQRDYYRQQYNTITQDYTKYTEPMRDEEQPQEEKKERISDILKASGWGLDLALHPEQFAKDDAYSNEYHRLVQFLPENLAKTSVAHTKAKAEAKKVKAKAKAEKIKAKQAEKLKAKTEAKKAKAKAKEKAKAEAKKAKAKEKAEKTKAKLAEKLKARVEAKKAKEKAKAEAKKAKTKAKKK